MGGAAACRACTCQLGRGGKNADDVVLVAVAVVSWSWAAVVRRWYMQHSALTFAKHVVRCLNTRVNNNIWTSAVHVRSLLLVNNLFIWHLVIFQANALLNVVLILLCIPACYCSGGGHCKTSLPPPLMFNVQVWHEQRAHCNNSVLWVVLIMCDCNNMMVLTSPRHNNITLDTLSSGHLITEIQGETKKYILRWCFWFWICHCPFETSYIHLNCSWLI